MVRSITLTDDDPVPGWARYAAVFVDSKSYGRSTVQYFRARGPCEAWARAVMRHMPRPADDGPPGVWTLVRALPPVGRDRIGSSGVCYLAFDPGGIVVKRHAIPPEYGHAAARTTAYAAY